jgi:hypothetical protein
VVGLAVPAPPERGTAGGRDTAGQVKPVVIPSRLWSLPGAGTVVAGDQFLLAATARGSRGEPVPGQDVAWSSSRPAVADVSAEGEVTALAPGRATITARIAAESASVVVNVRALRAATVSVQPATLRLKVGGSAQIRARLLDERGEEIAGVVVWNSTDPAVADISPRGVVTARGAGPRGWSPPRTDQRRGDRRGRRGGAAGGASVRRPRAPQYCGC